MYEMNKNTVFFIGKAGKIIGKIDRLLKSSDSLLLLIQMTITMSEKFKMKEISEENELAKKLSFKASLRSFTKSRFKLCSCYGWTLCICPNFIFWRLKPQGDSFWNWSLGRE